MREGYRAAGLAAGIFMGAILASTPALARADALTKPAPQAVVSHYADLAEAMYGAALDDAADLRRAVTTLIAEPSALNMAWARGAWFKARRSYQQTEAFRFGNPVVDDWEGRVNSWPLDEGLIDYVDTSKYGDASDENRLYTANVIANPQISFGGKTLDASRITPALLQDKLQEADNIEANVATGYHAIEFLLWGQDLNGTGPGAGNRPWTDYDLKNCTGGHCDRRVEYLKAATDLLVDDLKEIYGDWGRDGAARQELLAREPVDGLAAILTGLGSLSYGELAGERIQLGILLHDPEEEQDCFSDNTHNSHYYDQVGMMAVYNGRYTRPDGSVITGPGLSALVAAADPALERAVQGAMATTLGRMDIMKDVAEGGMAYDQMLAADNLAGNRVLQDVVDALKQQARQFERVAPVLGISLGGFEGSDSLDNPSAVAR